MFWIQNAMHATRTQMGGFGRNGTEFKEVAIVQLEVLYGIQVPASYLPIQTYEDWESRIKDPPIASDEMHSCIKEKLVMSRLYRLCVKADLAVPLQKSYILNMNPQPVLRYSFSLSLPHLTYSKSTSRRCAGDTRPEQSIKSPFS